MTALELCKKIGSEFDLDDSQADYILYEYTGFPSFWPRSDLSAEENLTIQLRGYFQSLPSQTAKTIWERL